MADIGVRVLVTGTQIAQRNLDSINRSLGTFENTILQTAGSSRTLGTVVDSVGKDMMKLGRNLTIGVTLPVTAAMGSLIGEGIKFQDSFAGVSKTVDGVADSTGQLTVIGKQLREQFRQLALEIPISVNELARIGEVSGQLGIARSQLVDFTEQMALLGVTTDLTGDQAAFTVARIGNIMGVANEEMGKFAKQFGNALVELGNNAAATESEIANLAFRIAGAGRAVGLTTPQILGLSAALSEAGIKAEMGGTAVSRIFLEMSSAAADGGDQLALFAKAAGVTSQEFANLVKNSPLDAFTALLGGLADMQEAGQLTSDTWKDMGLNSIRLRDVVNRLGPNMELVAKNVALSNKEWVNQNALTAEATKRFATIKSQLQLLKNTFVDLGITIFDLVEGDLAKFISFIRNGINAFKELDPTIQKTIVRIAGLAAALGPLMFIGGAILRLFGSGLLKFEGLTKLFKILPKLGGLKFGGILNLPKLLFGNVTKLSKGIVELFTSAISGITPIISDIFGNLFNTIFGGARSLLFGTLQGLVSGISTAISFVLTPIAGFFTNTIGSTIVGVFKSTFGIVETILGSFASVIKDTFSIAGSVVGKFAKTTLGLLPKVFSGFLGIFGFLPKLILLAGGALLAAFAPKVITNLIKNWKGVFKELGNAVSQFMKDIKSFGVEKALLLLFGGGSTGSGRGGNLMAIAKALGATELAARQFSYAMGTAVYWIIQTVKATTSFVKTLFSGNSALDTTNNKLGSTSDRLISLASAFAEFSEGFFVGWVSSFEDIRAAGQTFVDALGGLFTAVSNLFDTVFGKAEKSALDFYDALEPGTKSAASNFGQTMGNILGKLVTLLLQGAALAANLATVLINTFSTIVSSYKENGIEGIFGSLNTILETLFNGFIDVASTLWSIIKPHFVSFVDSAVEWITNEGIPALGAAFNSLGNLLSKILLGTQDQIEIRPPVADVFNVDTGEYLGQISQQMYQEAKASGMLGENPFNQLFFEWKWGQPEQTEPTWQGLVKVIRDLLSRMADFIANDAWPTIKPAIETVWKELTNWIDETAIPKAKEFGQNIADSISDGFEEKAFNFVDGLADALLPDTFNRKEEELQIRMNTFGGGLATATIDGYVAGIIENREMSRLELLSVMEDGYNSVKDFLQAGSPSMLFYGLGSGISEGLANGINANSSRVSGAISAIYSIISHYVSLITGAFGAVSSLFGSIDSNVAPTSVNINNNTNSSVFAPQISGVPMNNSRDMGNEVVRLYNMAAVG